MPLPIPDLDDLSYEQLVEEAQAQIAALYPQWTDRNPSDTGITLIELFAWLVEMLIYRVNRVPDANYAAFLKLLNGPTWHGLDGEEALEGAIQQSIIALRQRYRAVTADDYVHLLTEVWPSTAMGIAAGAEYGTVARAHCVPNRNLDAENGHAEAKGHVSLVVVTDRIDGGLPGLSPDLREALWSFLDDKRLLTTRHHVVGPAFVDVTVTAHLSLHDVALRGTMIEQAAAAMNTFYHPLNGGADGRGWPFGRSIYVSEVYELLDELPGIDYVENVTLTADKKREQRDEEDGDLIGIALDAHELVDIDVNIDV